MSVLTQELVRHLLSYDPSTGHFMWQVKRRGVSTSRVLGTDNGFGYLRITVCGISYYAHRLAWLYCNGYMPTNEIDHINGERSDNRICNLREVAHHENQQNRRKAQSNSASGYLGVSWSRCARKWQAHIAVQNKHIYLGVYENVRDAYEAVLNAKRRYHPRSNFVELESRRPT